MYTVAVFTMLTHKQLMKNMREDTTLKEHFFTAVRRTYVIRVKNLWEKS